MKEQLTLCTNFCCDILHFCWRAGVCEIPRERKEQSLLQALSVIWFWADLTWLCSNECSTNECLGKGPFFLMKVWYWRQMMDVTTVCGGGGGVKNRGRKEQGLSCKWLKTYTFSVTLGLCFFLCLKRVVHFCVCYISYSWHCERERHWRHVTRHCSLCILFGCHISMISTSYFIFVK